MNEEYFHDTTLINSLDTDIVMHRDAHFSGRFDIMLEYYHSGGKGCHPDFTVERITYLARCEQELGQNLAGVLLTGIEAEKVFQSRQAYKALRDIYEVEQGKAAYPRLIADLILSEDEEPLPEIKAIVAQGVEIVPFLHDLLHSDQFLSSLSPGYGQAPALAAICLGHLANERSVMSLFEALGKGDFLLEERVLEGLRRLEPLSKPFLLRILKQKPITVDSERAAVALSCFSLDPEVAQAKLGLLEEPAFQKLPTLTAQLILGCEGLQDEAHRARFCELMQNEAFQSYSADAQLIASTW